MPHLVKVRIELDGYIGINGSDNPHHAVAIADKRMKGAADIFDLIDMLTEDPTIARAYGARATDVEDV